MIMNYLTEIFRKYGKVYLSEFHDKILPSHRKVINDISKCRMPESGGKVYKCKVCKKDNYSYHSCNNRSCPKCGGDKIKQWVKKQFSLLLPVPYFFVTFTLPAEFRSVVRSNQKYFYSLFFRTSARALKILAKEKRFVGGDIGFMGVIQTWARNLIYHPHIHYIVPMAALSSDRKKFLKIKNKKFLVHVKPLGMLFKKLFRQELKETEFYSQIPCGVWEKNWVVHAEPAGYGREVIKYIAPYVYRAAISNNKIKKFENEEVTFEYKDYETKEIKECTLPVLEFMRRFLQHVLPSGFMKVRYFGIMSANQKKKWLMLKQIIYSRLSKKSKTRFLNIENFQPEKKTEPCCRFCGGELIVTNILYRAP